MSIESIIRRKKGMFVSKVRKITSVAPVKDSPVMGLVLCHRHEKDEVRMEALDILKAQDVGCGFVINGDVVKYHPMFMKKALVAGFEFINGGYSGRPFSVKNLKDVEGLPEPLCGYEQCFLDVTMLHDAVYADFGYTMVDGMPAWGAEMLLKSITVYDLYDDKDYQYIAGSINVNKNSVNAEVSRYSADIQSLNGQILVADMDCAKDLEPLLRQLREAGFRVVSPAELQHISPFKNIGPGDECFDDLLRLVENGFPAVCRNNCFYPRSYEIFGDTAMIIAPKSARMCRVESVLNNKARLGHLNSANPYSGVMKWSRDAFMTVKFEFPTTNAILGRVFGAIDIDVKFTKLHFEYFRKDLIPVYADILCASEDNDPYGLYEPSEPKEDADAAKSWAIERFRQIKAELEGTEAETLSSPETEQVIKTPKESDIS